MIKFPAYFINSVWFTFWDISFKYRLNMNSCDTAYLEYKLNTGAWHPLPRYIPIYPIPFTTINSLRVG
ncbi:MAG: hypothetical protein EBX41_04375 [Chitinophagia bacterium]|nr:hypothetical protein [Chitinophagia bacterium]NDA64445.1 hypothetical protein [Chitinophagia bacterium]